MLKKKKRQIISKKIIQENTEQPQGITLLAGETLSSMCLVSDSITWSDKDFLFFFFFCFQNYIFEVMETKLPPFLWGWVKAVHQYIKRQSSFSSPLMKTAENVWDADTNPIW